MSKGPQWYRDTPADRRKRVAELHGKGIPNYVIAKRLGIADTTVSQDLLFLGLRTPRAATPDLPGPALSVRSRPAGEPGPHDLAKLDLIGLQALFLDGLTPPERRLVGKTAAFTLAELSRETLIAAILRQRKKTPGRGSPRAPGPGSARAISPLGAAPVRAGGGGRTGDAARPAPIKLDGCTCGGIGSTGSHYASCPWSARWAAS